MPVSGGAPSLTPAEAGVWAAAFAADYLSWDEDDPTQRGAALAGHAVGCRDEAGLGGAGWSGCGRQRVFATLPGRVQPIGPQRVVVHVRVQVTPYVREAAAGSAAGPQARAAVVVVAFPSSAPAPCAPGWRPVSSCWYELLVPLVAEQRPDGGERWGVDMSTVWVVPPPPTEHVPEQQP